MGHSPIPTQNAGTSGMQWMLNLGLTAVQNLPKIYLKQLIVEKDMLKLQSPELFILSSFTKWNHHKAIYLDHIGSATHRNTFMSWDPLLHPELLLRIYIKYRLLKNISTIPSKQQLAAFSTTILSIPYINSHLRIHGLQHTHAYGWNCMLTLSDNGLTPHPVSLCALVSRKLRTKFSAQL